MDDVVHARPKVGFDGGHFAPFEKPAKPVLGGFDDGLAQRFALEEIDVLPGDRRQ